MEAVKLKDLNQPLHVVLLALICFANWPTLARSESASPIGQSLGSNICAPDPAGETYFTDLQLTHFRKLFVGSKSSASFYDLSVADRKVVSEALRVGQGAGLFAAKLLRDLAIIEDVELQKGCDRGAPCKNSSTIERFKIAEMAKDRSWTELVAFWSRVRDDDANAGRACLASSSSLPDRASAPITEQETSQTKTAAEEEPQKTQPDKQREKRVEKIQGAIGSVTAVLRPFSKQGTSDTDLCAPEPTPEKYPTDIQLERLRQRFTGTLYSAAFLDLSRDERRVVSEALRVGHGVMSFADRLLRDLVIIEALDQQVNCSSSEPCENSILKYFKIDEIRDRPRADLVKIWRGFRDEDANAGRVCLPISNSLPTRATTPQIAEQIAAAGPPQKPRPEEPEEKLAVKERNAAKDIQPALGNEDFDCRERLSSILGQRNFTFAKSSATINKEDLKFLDGTAKAFKTCASIRLYLQGHTDSDGSKDYNLRLSSRRAEAVAAALSAGGVNEAQLVKKGFGDARPLVPNSSREGKRKNRRVEVSIL